MRFLTMAAASGPMVALGPAALPWMGALRAAGLVTREDFKDAGKRISALKRKVRELADELDELIAQQKK